MTPLTEHPAKFSAPILLRLRSLLEAERRRLGRSPLVLDPFAGVGRIHSLLPTTVGVELQPRWAACHRRTVCGNALHLPFASATFDAAATSPCYASRMADHHNARDGSRRYTYTHAYGEPLHPDNAGAMQWGDEYRWLHVRAWAELLRCLRPGALLVVNLSDHVRAHRLVLVTEWHAIVLTTLGCTRVEGWAIPTRRMLNGENAAARAPHEAVLVLRAPLELAA